MSAIVQLNSELREWRQNELSESATKESSYQPQKNRLPDTVWSMQDRHPRILIKENLVVVESEQARDRNAMDSKSFVGDVHSALLFNGSSSSDRRVLGWRCGIARCGLLNVVLSPTFITGPGRLGAFHPEISTPDRPAARITTNDTSDL
jgi:hypothetical protein